MICPICGAAVEDGAKFCPACGAQMPQPAEQQAQPTVTGYCPKCGQPYYGNPANCPSCGASLASGTGEIGKYFPPSGNGKVPNRSIGLYIVLTLITCGIFGLYWFVCIVNDLNTASDQPNDTSGITVLLLDIVTCGIYGIYWIYKAGEKVSVIKRKIGEPDSGNSSILYLVLQLLQLGLINYCLIQNEINKVANR